jgi:hypothetical protein
MSAMGAFRIELFSAHCFRFPDSARPQPTFSTRTTTPADTRAHGATRRRPARSRRAAMLFMRGTAFSVSSTTRNS